MVGFRGTGTGCRVVRGVDWLTVFFVLIVCRRAKTWDLPRIRGKDLGFRGQAVWGLLRV